MINYLCEGEGYPEDSAEAVPSSGPGRHEDGVSKAHRGQGAGEVEEASREEKSEECVDIERCGGEVRPAGMNVLKSKLIKY